jgi:hypothetical protein
LYIKETCNLSYRNTYMNLVGKPDGRRPLGRYRRRWDDKIKPDFTETGWGRGGVDWLRIGTSGGLL